VDKFEKLLELFIFILPSFVVAPKGFHKIYDFGCLNLLFFYGFLLGLPHSCYNYQKKVIFFRSALLFFGSVC